MDDNKKGYAVFFFPPALEALGEAIQPYLVEGPGGPHVLCREIDTGGALVQMTLDGMDREGQIVEVEIMVPTNMVRMIVSVRGEGTFGFGPRPPVVMELIPTAGPNDAPRGAPPRQTETGAVATAVPEPKPGPKPKAKPKAKAKRKPAKPLPPA